MYGYQMAYPFNIHNKYILLLEYVKVIYLNQNSIGISLVYNSDKSDTS